jgi:hypothetical protein
MRLIRLKRTIWARLATRGGGKVNAWCLVGKHGGDGVEDLGVY